MYEQARSFVCKPLLEVPELSLMKPFPFQQPCLEACSETPSQGIESSPNGLLEKVEAIKSQLPPEFADTELSVSVKT